MPAPSFATLYDFPGQVSSAWGAILTADLTTLIGTDTHATNTSFLFGPRDNSTANPMPVDRITYSATAFTQASDQQVVATSTTGNPFFFAHYSGQLHTVVSTPRSVNVSAAMHGTRVGRILFLAQAPAQKFTTNNLPYYEIASLTLSNQPRAEPADTEDADVTEIIHDLHLWIKPDAFPISLA